MADLTKPMYGYWKRQPEVLRDILLRRGELVAEFVKVYAATTPGHLYLVGSGTSLNACRAAAPYMSAFLGIEVTPVVSSRVPELYGPNPMVVFLSQGGSSTNTLEAMAKLSRWPYVTITGEEESEIHRRSAHHMFIGCGEELAGPKTIGYTASVLNLTLCGLEAALAVGKLEQPAYEAKIALLTQAAMHMQENLERTEAWFERNREALLQLSKGVIVGMGSAADAAQEGALKLQETVKAPMMAFEFEEYLHGPLLMTDENLAGMFFLTPDPATLPKMRELARCHAEFSKYTFRVTGGAEEEGGDATTLHLLTTGDPLTECYEYILAPQLVSARVPVILGLPDGAEIYTMYVSAWETKYQDGR